MYPGYNYSPYDMMGMNMGAYQMPQRGLGGLFRGLTGRGGTGAAAGMMGAMKGKFNWGGLLNNTQRTLGIINQAIPIFYQVRPMWNNAKVMFNIMNAVKGDDKPKTATRASASSASSSYQGENTEVTTSQGTTQEGRPNFFL